MKKNIIIIILSILVISSFGYLIFDKIINHQEQNPNSKAGLIENNKENKTTNKEDTNNNSISTNLETTKEENYTEEDIISYFESLDKELTSYNDQSLSKTIKEKFVKCIDFIFYGEEIGGKTFKELTDSAKLKILEITISIDSKIDNHFPKYKETISNKYQDIKSKVVETYLETTTNICNNDQELCTKAKEGFQDLKEGFDLTWDLIKDLVGTGTSKLKDWYEIWRYN